jgi:hypothetical protein
MKHWKRHILTFPTLLLLLLLCISTISVDARVRTTRKNMRTAEVPVAEMFGFSSDIRGTTQGRAIWSIENSGFKQLMPDLQKKVVTEIRTRKGLNPEPYDEKYYSGM